MAGDPTDSMNHLSLSARDRMNLIREMNTSMHAAGAIDSELAIPSCIVVGFTSSLRIPNSSGEHNE
jgi:hypothetical protein